MDGVKPFGQLLGQAQAPLRDDPQAALLEPVVDGAGQVAPGCIRLDDREGAFDGHRETRSGWGAGFIAAVCQGGNPPVAAPTVRPCVPSRPGFAANRSNYDRLPWPGATCP